MPQTEYENDGSLAEAVLRMPSIDEMERQSETREGRDTSGKFKARDNVPAEKPAPPESKPPSKALLADAEDEEDDYIEMPPEEDGKEPARHKLSEVIDGWRRAKDLEVEVERAKKSQPLPSDYEAALHETIEERQKYAQALRQYAYLSQPREPDEDMINPSSPKYQPERYWNERNAYRQAWQNQQIAMQRLEQIEEENEEKSEALFESKKVRERARLVEGWPEIAKTETVQHVRRELEKRYGIDAATIATIYDSRFYFVVRDALKNVASAESKSDAVKAVRAKPKLVRATARQQSARPGRDSDAYGRLEKSGSLEDAADALAGLI